MKFHPALRHNRHMLRLIRTGDGRKPYALGSAYGNEFEPVDATERRRRILDQWCIPNQSPRRPESPSTAQQLSRRSEQAYFPQLHDETRALLSRRHSAEPLDRRDARPGTRSRMQLGRDHCALGVESWPHMGSPQSSAGLPKPDPRTGGRLDAFGDSFGRGQQGFIGSSLFPARRR